jgi:hypothetical protein
MPPSQGWKTFLRNHADGIASMDLFLVPTISADPACRQTPSAEPPPRRCPGIFHAGDSKSSLPGGWGDGSRQTFDPRKFSINEREQAGGVGG